MRSLSSYFRIVLIAFCAVTARKSIVVAEALSSEIGTLKTSPKEQVETGDRLSTPRFVSSPVPKITIGRDINGDEVVLPLVGVGTGSHENSTSAYQSVCLAFGVGYDFVDTAYNYHNEEGVGKAIRDCYTKDRKDLFVMTKVPGGLKADEVYAAHKQNLMELGLEYVDHLMFHFPSAWHDNDASSPSSQLRQEGWLALEEIYKSGEARSIGFSHYCPQHIHDIMEVATITPSINQVECHIGSGDSDHVRQTCKDYGITFMSYSPLCGNCKYEPEDSLISGKLVTEIASHYKHNTTGESTSGSQVSLRFVVQQSIPIIPRSLSKDHLISNLNIFDFELSDDDMKTLSEATEPGPHSLRDCEVP